LYIEFLATDMYFRGRSIIAILIVCLCYFIINISYTMTNLPVYLNRCEYLLVYIMIKIRMDHSTLSTQMN
jgi:hypothetical protein